MIDLKRIRNNRNAIVTSNQPQTVQKHRKNKKKEEIET